MRHIFTTAVRTHKQRTDLIKNSVLAFAFAGAIGYATNNFEPTEGAHGKAGGYFVVALLGFSARRLLGLQRN